MALDARSRSSIYQKLVPTLGEHDANVLMSEFPSVEADELVTKQFLRAELADQRTWMEAQMHRQTVWLGGALAGATALLATLGALTP